MNDFAKEVFKTLYEIEVDKHTEKKGGYNYLKWAVAIRILLEHYPESSWRVLNQSEINMGLDHSKVGGFIVGTEVTVQAGVDFITRREYLPIINYSNKIVIEPDFMAVNTAIKRCLVKNIAMFGLGMKIFEGVAMAEDSFDGEGEMDWEEKETEPEPKNSNSQTKLVTEKQGKFIYRLFKEAGYKNKGITEKLIELYGVEMCDEIPASEANTMIDGLQARIEKGKKESNE
jgi:hypothetical protein